MRRYLVDNMWSLIVLAATVVVAVVMWERLPASVPMHFDPQGQPDRFSEKGIGLFWLIAFGVAYLGLMPLLLKISPRGFRLEGQEHDVGRLNLAVIVLLCGIQLTVMYAAADPAQFSVARGAALSMGLFLVLLGNCLGRINRNYIIGIRVPWTMRSEQNWKATHRFAGRVFVGAGCLTLMGVLLGVPVVVAAVALAVSIIAPVIYSYSFHRREKAEKGTELRHP